MSLNWHIYLFGILLLTGTVSELFCKSTGIRTQPVPSAHDNHSPGNTAFGIDTVDIPDPEFLNALIWWGVDTNKDNIISTTEAEAVIMLYVSDRDITNLSGIEAFINLESLYCVANQLTSLDVSACSSLTFLDCGFNKLTNLDLSSNADLTTLYCGWNELTDLDVSNSEYLAFLDCGCNQLTVLDVSRNPLMQTLYCGWNQLTSLDLTTNPALTFLDCTSNQIDHLDISASPLLNNLYCAWNELTNLDVSNSKYLVFLDCGVNQLSSLDISASPLLNTLYCGWNRLTQLDVGNNTDLRELFCSSNNLYNLDISNNTSLDTLELQYMSDLYKVCVWALPFPPPGLGILMDESPNIYFTTECGDMQAPELEIPENDLYRPEFISAISSEDGMIYLVPEHTRRNLGEVCSLCKDSVLAVAGEITLLPPDHVSNGVYWLYARDLSYNLSAYKEINISGVGMNIYEQESITVYPIPARNLLYIEAAKPGTYSFAIISSNGLPVYKDHMTGSTHQVDLSYMQKGVYFITIRSKDFVTTKKIIKL